VPAVYEQAIPKVRPKAVTSGAVARWWDRHFHYALLLPLVVGLAALVAFPLLYGLYYSFTNYRLLSAAPAEWVGLRNYERLLHDRIFVNAVKHTLWFGLVAIHLEFAIAMLLAVLLARQVRGIGALRTLFVIPYMVGGVLVGFQFRWFFNDQFGMANSILLELHLIDRPIAWLVRHPLESIIAASIWHTAPFTAMLLLAGLLAVPSDLYDAAAVDGASRFRRFRDITLPTLLPLILLVLTMRYLAVLPLFDVVYTLTEGGPALKSDVVMTYVFRTAIQKGTFGIGSAASYLMLVAQLTLVVLQIVVVQRIRRGR
jgi:ABC-type sugar transport system permease subunit